MNGSVPTGNDAGMGESPIIPFLYEEDMNFNEAMEALKGGKKIARSLWLGEMYFVLYKNDSILCFRYALNNYIYDQSVLLSKGWLIDDGNKEHEFVEIIESLQKGSRAKLKEWGDSYIFLDKTQKTLVYRTNIQHSYIPAYEDFVAIDWIEQ